MGIYNPGTGSNSSNPGTQIGSNLTKVGTATTGTITFNASSITLKGGTTYFVQVTGTAAAGNPAFNLGTTASDAQDTTSTNGWSIADTSRSLSGTTWSNFQSGRTLRLIVNATTTTSVVASPTGFAGGSSTSYGYGSGSNSTTNISSSGQSCTFNESFLLRGEYSAIHTSQRLTCATGTTLEHGWYRSSAPKTRVGTGSVASRGGATVYRGDYTPTFSSEYQFLAYCTEGSGMSKVYSTAVNLMGTNGKVSLTGGPPAPPTLVGFTKVARVEYGRLRSTAPGSGDWQVDWRYVHGNALGTEIGVSNDVTCETGTAVEWGWYESNAPTTRVSGAPFLGQISIGDAAPGEYQALAYCTRGSGVSKVYSIAVNLMGGNGKVMISLEPTGWDSTLASPGGLSATPSPGAVRIDWSAVTGATNYQYRYKEGRANDRDPLLQGW